MFNICQGLYLVHGRARIEELKEELHRLEEEDAANLKRESKNYREEIAIIESRYL